MFSLLLCIVSLWVFCLPPTVQRHAVCRATLISDSKLPIGMNVNVNSCLSLCFRPTTDWRHTRCVFWMDLRKCCIQLKDTVNT